MSKPFPRLKDEKISEIFEEYAFPFLEALIKTAPKDASIEEFNQALRIPCIAWNQSVMEDAGIKISLSNHESDEIQGLLSFVPGMKDVIELFKERKQDLFKAHNCILEECNLCVNEKTSEYSVQVTVDYYLN